MMTKLDKMIGYFRKGENLYLESRTEMENYTYRQREKFHAQSQKLKEKGKVIYDYLVEKIGIDEEYLENLLWNEGI